MNDQRSYAARWRGDLFFFRTMADRRRFCAYYAGAEEVHAYITPNEETDKHLKAIPAAFTPPDD